MLDRLRDAAGHAVTSPVETRIRATGGVELAVRVSRRGPRRPGVLLVHGLASNARLWDGVAARLAELGHPVAAVDQRGHGHSDKPDTGYDFATLTADLAAVIDAPGLGAAPRRRVRAGAATSSSSWPSATPTPPGRSPCVDGGTIELAGHFPTWEVAPRRR